MDYSSFQPSWWTWIHLKEVFVIWYVTYSFSSAVQLFSILCLYSGSINTHTLKSYTWSCTAHRTGFVDFFPLNESEIIESDPGLKIRAQQLSLFSFTLYCTFIVYMCRWCCVGAPAQTWQPHHDNKSEQSHWALPLDARSLLQHKTHKLPFWRLC